MLVTLMPATALVSRTTSIWGGQVKRRIHQKKVLNNSWWLYGKDQKHSSNSRADKTGARDLGDLGEATGEDAEVAEGLGEGDGLQGLHDGHRPTLHLPPPTSWAKPVCCQRPLELT